MMFPALSGGVMVAFIAVSLGFSALVSTGRLSPTVDIVTLHGQVPTADKKTKAADVVKKLDGVKEVKHLLQVVPNAERKAVKRSDDEIKKDLDAAWKSHKDSTAAVDFSD